MLHIKMQTADNIVLKGTIYLASEPKAVVMVNPGTATKTSYYLPFAKFLVEQGFHVLLWNYRGFCESKSAPLKGCHYRYSDIGRYDMPAAIDEMKTRYPDLPLYCVGHSAGGQQIGLAHNYSRIDKLAAVGVSAGYFPDMPLGYRLKANFFFRLFGPLSNVFFRYVPASKLKLMEDLPSGFVTEWGAWCKEKHLFFSPKFYGKTVPLGTYKNFTLPTHVFVADDDEICTEANVTNFWNHVAPIQPIKFTQYKANQQPSKKVGHFGYFHKKHQEIWLDIVSSLKGGKRG